MTEKQNRFEKAANERRAQLVEENDHVADAIMQTKVDIDSDTDENDIDTSLSLKSVLTKTKPRKRQCSYYLDSKIDDFFMRFSEITDSSKSELINQLLTIAILGNPDIQEMANSNKKIQKILDEFQD